MGAAGEGGLSRGVFTASYWLLRSHICSLSLWRVVRGSKLMHLDHLIHGLFIT
jgi:hypothetical protein